MQKIKRPLLLLGLVMTTILSILYIFSQLLNLTSKIILFFYIVILVFNIGALKTVNMTKKDFKKGKWFTWVIVILMFIYDLFEFSRILNYLNLTGGIIDNQIILMSGLLFISLFALLLCTCGVLTRVIDNKITYEEHLKQTKNK